MNTYTRIAAVVTACLLLPLQAGAQAPSDRWTFSLMPYLWLPTVDATLNYGPPPAGGSGANVEIDGEDILEALNFGLMLQGEARKGRWLFAGDLIYLDFGNQSSRVRSVDFNPGPGPVNVATSQLNAGTQSSLDATAFTLVGGYSIVNDAATTLDLIAGVRYMDVTVRTDYNLTVPVTGPAGTTTFARAGSIERSSDLFDGIVGARGRIRLGESQWFVPYHVDIGAGSSDLTWQGVIGAGYAFRWGEVQLSYRYLYYDEGDDKFIQELSFGGPAIGVNFRF
ncbi:MAG: hypothetical protein ACXW14_09890 [Burkholderiaceae bacterium]